MTRLLSIKAWPSQPKIGTMTSTVRIIVPLGTREPGGTVTVINPTWTVAIFRALTPLMLKGWTGKDGGVMITQSGEQRWKSNQLILKNEAYSCRNDFHKNLPVIYLYSSSLKKPWIEWLDDSISYVELTKIYRSCTYDINLLFYWYAETCTSASLFPFLLAVKTM